MMIFRRDPDEEGSPAKSGKAPLRATLLRDTACRDWLALDELAVHYLYHH